MIGRGNFGVTIGVVTGIVAHMLIVQIGMMVYPPSTDLDPNDIEAVTAMIAEMPLGQLMFTYVGHLAQAGLGSIAGCLSNRQTATRTGMLVGGVTAMFCMLNLSTVPHPDWFWTELPLTIGLGVGIGRWLQQPSEV